MERYSILKAICALEQPAGEDFDLLVGDRSPAEITAIKVLHEKVAAA